MNATYRIVAGVDGSEGGRRALRWAVEHAAARGGTVQAVAAWSWAPSEAALLSGPTPDDMRASAEAALADAVHALGGRPPVPLALEAIEGRAAKVLTRAAVDAQLLVVGSHGHNRLMRAMLGSVSEECVRGAVCPVVVIPVPHDATSQPHDLLLVETARVSRV
jgi:nucleotide-binding universal stress UspA family protein